MRTPTKKPIDNLKPEGKIDFTDKTPYKPAEKVAPTKPKDNLYVTGDFNGIHQLPNKDFDANLIALFGFQT